MPANLHRPTPCLEGVRLDLQGEAHLFVNSLFAGCTVLDVGAGLGHSKARMRHNRVTTWDIDVSMAPHLDAVGGEPPAGPFDLVTAFDVIEHVEDDLAFARMLASRARRAVFITTPNWELNRCASAFHFREYTPAEMAAFALSAWDYWQLPKGVPDWQLRFFAYFKDAQGGWFDPVPPTEWMRHRGRKHGVLAIRGTVRGNTDAARIDAMMAGRWEASPRPDFATQNEGHG